MTGPSFCLQCNGAGWLWDSTDSGSGAQVYCDCEHGRRLRQFDEHNARKLTPRSPSSGTGDGT